ncbi:type IV pili twitching motility protein PilT [Candidatus Curtissbacteria bacterium RIFCSPHIGHO2_01_FULL_41_44]|uniref:Type IV pili twitching motility protein PilT n=1 Tax=Candidatus Curtissbacteria bacterium RIFCSPLOWO2_01_FULL_42_50 TaxID=1797730 RepID=A0A1F5H7U7_9BACT|nr:MAG: type IV pili twitching motility protein PilT [Candidatus Curtissbacteria bacterium RIFCSPHIGHO2_01_FULL_41_44]OGD94274.1 MAG: type IV pili twitching motility protein PilT [Candidatus Curtissbacteria bacterium RIFCSPHIGHO2_02_FULL_42_58]OGD97748.1 MAG: type IV pili twitching motility protein PilT [Candidatus Curtissbacteria bacterium RIFCSPHIGHO2_12_FULL_42_33]OGE00140.1 MAG: type IV pili twitching motility protein PilT [Candidatus Curtissbacteria bacterium RIFCSPLOWO2_01_FULL_42_50]OGE0
MSIQEFLEIVIRREASDLHLIAGSPPMMRSDGQLMPITSAPLTPEETESLVFELLSAEQREILIVNKELDLSFALGDVARFRVNAYFQKGYLSAALRLIPSYIKTIEELNLPKICHNFAKLRQGFILVTGPTGHGKSTTIASMTNEINLTRAVHIVTIEDPIEYVYPKGKSLISQREMHLDTHSWEMSLRSALREDPDVVLVGEMRDFETIASAITVAETGHLVFATLHTNSAAQSIDRIIDVFPENQQMQVRLQLAATIAGIISIRLVPAIGGGRLPVCEILLSSGAVQTAIREGKTHQIDNIIQTSGEAGMILLDASLAYLVRAGRISLDIAKTYSMRPEELDRLVGNNSS